MAGLTKRARTLLYIAITLLMLLFMLAGFAARPHASINFVDMCDSNIENNSEYYTLAEGDYIVARVLSTVNLRKSPLPWPTGKTYTYFEVNIRQGSAEPFIAVVRACGDKWESLLSGHRVPLYGMVSECTVSTNGIGMVPCLTDNGETVIGRTVLAILFFILSGVCDYFSWAVKTGRALGKSGVYRHG